MSVSGSIDTNVLLRLLLQDVPHQHVAALGLLKGTNGQLHVADAVFIETAFVLERHYKFARQAISEAFEVLVAMAELNFNRPLIHGAMPLFVKHPALSIEDCCLAMYAELNNAEPLWTFDKKLANQAPSAKLVA